MAITLSGIPRLTITPSTPNFRMDKVGVQSAEFDAQADVKFTGEVGNKYLVGFVQILEKNMMQAVYRRTTRNEVLKDGKSFPIRDGNKSLQYRPFYGTINPATIVQISTDPEQVHVTMSDEPESRFPYWLNDDRGNPLEEFIMDLQFQLYVAVRNISNPASMTFVMTYLKQWTVSLNCRYQFTVVEDHATTLTPGLPPRPDLLQTTCRVADVRQPTISVVAYPKGPDHRLLELGDVANGSFVDHDVPRGRTVVSSNIQALGSKIKLPPMRSN